jgi:hypothetical protein
MEILSESEADYIKITIIQGFPLKESLKSLPRGSKPLSFKLLTKVAVLLNEVNSSQ